MRNLKNFPMPGYGDSVRTNLINVSLKDDEELIITSISTTMRDPTSLNYLTPRRSIFKDRVKGERTCLHSLPEQVTSYPKVNLNIFKLS